MFLTLLKWTNGFPLLYYVSFAVEHDTLDGYTNTQKCVAWAFPSICTSFTLAGHVYPLYFSNFCVPIVVHLAWKFFLQVLRHLRQVHSSMWHSNILVIIEAQGWKAVYTLHWLLFSWTHPLLISLRVTHILGLYDCATDQIRTISKTNLARSSWTFLPKPSQFTWTGPTIYCTILPLLVIVASLPIIRQLGLLVIPRLPVMPRFPCPLSSMVETCWWLPPQAYLLSQKDSQVIYGWGMGCALQSSHSGHTPEHCST